MGALPDTKMLTEIRETFPEMDGKSIPNIGFVALNELMEVVQEYFQNLTMRLDFYQLNWNCYTSCASSEPLRLIPRESSSAYAIIRRLPALRSKL